MVFRAINFPKGWTEQVSVYSGFEVSEQIHGPNSMTNAISRF